MEANMWMLFNEAFKIGEEVIIITDDDKYLWGELISVTDTRVEIQRPGMKVISLEWDEVRFMSHDGFPVRKLLGADGSQSVEQMETVYLMEMVRSALNYEPCGQCGKLTQKGQIQRSWGKDRCPTCYAEVPRRTDPPYTTSFGDPFLIEGVSAQLFNAGNNSPYFWYWSDRYIETLVLTAKDGAMAHLWDLETVYHFE